MMIRTVYLVQYKLTMIKVTWVGRRGPCRTYRSFATTVSQLKMCDFPGESFKDFEVL